MVLPAHDNCIPGVGLRRLETVTAPPAHAGIGNALRRAYCESASALPSDMAALLDKLR